MHYFLIALMLFINTYDFLSGTGTREPAGVSVVRCNCLVGDVHYAPFFCVVPTLSCKMGL